MDTESRTPAGTLDVTRDVCPLTFVKTKLELEGLSRGDLLEVFVRDGEPLHNVTRSCEQDGHRVIEKQQQANGKWRLLIRRGDSA
ncbi:sulfurtransferase TusA family protein [Candidatus Sumerlaeota bacterium]|nr:sulfurtransferase TusA family protein [Candidatus Sumerlaeota bacterium]